MTRAVSILGLGPQGAQAARRLLQGQPELDLTVFDRDDQRCEPFRGLATLAGSAAEALRESSVIVLALEDTRDVDRALKRYSDGAVTLAVQDKTVVDLCPRRPTWRLALAQALAQAGAVYLPREAADPPALLRLIDAAPSAPSG